MAQLQFNQAVATADASSELDQICRGLKRTKLVHDMAVSLPEDMVDVITEMAMDTHEKDLMLPDMSRFLWWNRPQSHYPAFELPSCIFQPNLLDSGLVAVQIIDRNKTQYIEQLPAIVRYVILKYTKNTRYFFVEITSTFMARSRDNPTKVYYPYQIWKIKPSSYTTDPVMPVRSAEQINQDQDSERWENYWSDPLKSRVRRVRAFVRELKYVLKYEEFWIFFDGRIVVTLPKIWEDCDVDTSRLGNQECEKLLTKFQENHESLNLPLEIRSQLISKASRN